MEFILITIILIYYEKNMKIDTYSDNIIYDAKQLQLLDIVKLQLKKKYEI